nr:RnfH family protein [Candidatus Profftella armatura (Diaphorina cf. continua)]
MIKLICVQICYADSRLQVLYKLYVTNQTSIQTAILQSNILHKISKINLINLKVGIYGKLKKLNTILRDNDRVEIYRPLIISPKELRCRKNN